MKLYKEFRFDIIFVAVIHIAGIIGIHLAPEIFLKTSFVSIIIPLTLYLYRIKPIKIEWIIIFLVYLITFFSEWIGVNYGWLFGSYEYGDSLGFKIDGVPIIMGANWLLLGLVCRDVVKKIITNHWLIIILSALLMVLIDTLIEPLSNRLDFWTWKNNIIPFSNYKDWFLIALLNQYIFSFLKFKKDMFFWSLGYIIVLVLFFVSFYLK
jgi:putative membrane protein